MRIQDRKKIRRQKIISKLNSNIKDFILLFQRNEKEEVPLKDNKGIKKYRNKGETQRGK